jgi:hypothetical protein
MEDRKLRVFENKVLMKLYEPKEHELSEQFKKMRSQDPGDMYRSHFFRLKFGTGFVARVMR